MCEDLNVVELKTNTRPTTICSFSFLSERFKTRCYNFQTNIFIEKNSTSLAKKFFTP